MNTRLVWNFEITPNCQLHLPEAQVIASADTHWESRFFWSANDIIVLSGLDETFLELSRYKIKHRLDSYYLLPDADYNIKKRRDELVYKPILKRSPSAIEYGKKIKLKKDASIIELTSSTLTNFTSDNDHQSLVRKIAEQSLEVPVEKDALIYKFESHPSTKLEIARLIINHQVFYTLCVEAPTLFLVEEITRQLTKESPSQDYVLFLKKHTGLS